MHSYAMTGLVYEFKAWNYTNLTSRVKASRQRAAITQPFHILDDLRLFCTLKRRILKMIYTTFN